MFLVQIYIWRIPWRIPGHGCVGKHIYISTYVGAAGADNVSIGKKIPGVLGHIFGILGLWNPGNYSISLAGAHFSVFLRLRNSFFRIPEAPELSFFIISEAPELIFRISEAPELFKIRKAGAETAVRRSSQLGALAPNWASSRYMCILDICVLYVFP